MIDINKYRKWIAEYDRPSGPQTIITPNGWRDALREALDKIGEVEVRLANALTELECDEPRCQRELAEVTTAWKAAESSADYWEEEARKLGYGV